jgi:hypothetical protein
MHNTLISRVKLPALSPDNPPGKHLGSNRPPKQPDSASIAKPFRGRGKGRMKRD